ncbi:MAG: hypothetical protein MJ099_03785 [Clostridia bacterium]|nr:hypothetical protein [Clostridia bacterium]
MKRILSMLLVIILITAGAAFAEPRNMVIGTTVTDNISEYGEVDRFLLDLTGDTALDITFEFDVDSRYIVTLNAIANDGSFEKIFTQQFLFNGEALYDTVVREMATLRYRAGRYCLEVKNPEFHFSEKPYYITVTGAAVVPGAMEIECNDRPKDASEANMGVQVVGSLQAYEDVDYYCFYMPADGTLTIETGAAYDNELTYSLYEVVNGNELSRVDVWYLDYKDQGLGDMIYKTADGIHLAAGTYYLKVECQDFGDFTYDDYCFRLICVA